MSEHPDAYAAFAARLADLEAGQRSIVDSLGRIMTLLEDRVDNRELLEAIRGNVTTMALDLATLEADIDELKAARRRLQ